MVDLGSTFSGMGGAVMGWISGTLFWLIVIIAVVGVGFLALYFRKRRLMDKTVIEWHCVGNNNLMEDMIITKGGWFKNKITLKGLIDYGNERLFRLADMTPVRDVSHNDYKMCNGKLCLHVVRDPNDPKFVIPLGKFQLSQKAREMMAEIAPVDLRNAATSSIEETDIEMTSKWQQWAPIMVTIAMLLCLVFSIMFISQMEQKASDNNKAALKYGFDTMKELHIAYTPSAEALKLAGVNPEDVSNGAP